MQGLPCNRCTALTSYSLQQLSTDAGWHTRHIRESGTVKVYQRSAEEDACLRFWLGAVKIATFLPCGDPGSPATAALRSPATKRRPRQVSTDAGWHTAHINEPGTGKADQRSGGKMCAIYLYEFWHASVTVTVLHLCGNSGSPTSAALHSLPTPGPLQCLHCCRMLISADQATCHRRNRATSQMEDACPLPFDTASPTSHPAPALPFSPIGPTWVLSLLGFICA